jgi:hypothetical protein
MIKLNEKYKLSWILVCAIFALLICVFVWNHFRDNSKTASYIPYISAITTLFPNPKRYVDRSLTAEEIAKPKGRYATSGFTPDGNTLVSLNSPVKVPKLNWSKSFDSHKYFLSTSMLVDSEGNIWYPGSGKEGDISRVTLYCLKPDGTKNWERNIHGYMNFHPDFACEKAVICSGASRKIINSKDVFTRASRKITNPKDVFTSIECVSLDGKTIWRTDPMLEMEAGWSTRISRFSNNRLGVIRRLDNGMSIDYFDLSDGSHLDEINYERLLSFYPLEIPGGKIAGLLERQADSKTGFGVFNPDGANDWKFELPTRQHFAHPILTSDNNILVGTAEHLGKFDPDGNMIWYKVSKESWFKPIGLLNNGNYLVYDEKNSPQKDDLTTMYAYDPDGNVVWSYDNQLLPNNQGTTVFIYQDGNILFGHQRGISLMSSDGEIIWNINPEEPNPVEFRAWNIFPAPDDHIVAAGVIETDMDPVIKLYSFGIDD